MTSLQSLIRLQTWLSPSFPTGAFSYSHGLEAAISNGLVSNKQELSEWLSNLLNNGPGWNDAVLLAESWRRAHEWDEIQNVVELSLALSFSAERYLETTAQGNAFMLAAEPWVIFDQTVENYPLPVAVGIVSSRMDVALDASLTTYLHAYVSNQVQAALRLMKLGQQGAVELLSELENTIIATSKDAECSSLDDLGSSTVIADIAAMQHEVMHSRIFRS